MLGWVSVNKYMNYTQKVLALERKAPIYLPPFRNMNQNFLAVSCVGEGREEGTLQERFLYLLPRGKVKQETVGDMKW